MNDNACCNIFLFCYKEVLSNFGEFRSHIIDERSTYNICMYICIYYVYMEQREDWMDGWEGMGCHGMGWNGMVHFMYYK